jgi:hypothetical protein
VIKLRPSRSYPSKRGRYIIFTWGWLVPTDIWDEAGGGGRFCEDRALLVQPAPRVRLLLGLPTNAETYDSNFWSSWMSFICPEHVQTYTEAQWCTC